jgi:hypothetical protein
MKSGKCVDRVKDFQKKYAVRRWDATTKRIKMANLNIQRL